MLSDRRAAASAIAKALRSGVLPPVETLRCQTCGGPARLYHHPNGYDEAHWLDVVPLCHPHHVAVHPRVRGGVRPPAKPRTLFGPPAHYAATTPGQIICHLSYLMGKYRVTASRVARDTDIARSTVDGLYHGRVKRVDMETLDKLCRYFGVTVCDILEWRDA